MNSNMRDATNARRNVAVAERTASLQVILAFMPQNTGKHQSPRNQHHKSRKRGINAGRVIALDIRIFPAGREWGECRVVLAVDNPLLTNALPGRPANRARCTLPGCTVVACAEVYRVGSPSRPRGRLPRRTGGIGADVDQ
jgi:hypothetical protein